MTTITDPPKQQFRLSMLLNDTRYRSATIQVIAMMAFMLAFAWLLNNAASNLAALGKPLSFSFLSASAGYDINQHLIDYNSQMSHGRAALVGILNTLLVAVLGCISATVIGVFVGVMRLSNNWIVSRLMAWYVEGIRNVPVLLWIVLSMAIFVEVLPAPRAFKGDSPAASMYLNDSVAFTNRGFYIPKPTLESGSTIIVIVFLLSLVAIWGLGRWAKAQQEVTGKIYNRFWINLSLFVVPSAVVFSAMANAKMALLTFTLIAATIAIILTVYLLVYRQLRSNDHARWAAGALSIFVAIAIGSIWVVYFLPTISAGYVDLFNIGPQWNAPIGVDYPALKGFNFRGGFHLRNSLIALWFALSFYTATYIAEAVRAGIMAVSQGQTEAAYALGIRPGRTTQLVVLPQAMRIIIPVLISQYLNLTKNSSLAIAVGYMDITGTLGGITLNQTGREMESLLLLMAAYLSISLTVSVIMNIYNNSIKLKER